KPRRPQALKAMRRRSPGMVALLKWEFTIRRDNSLMSRCTAGKRRPLFSPSPHFSPVDGEEANPGIGAKARESLDNPNGAARPTISFDVRTACRRSNEALDRPRRHQQQRRAAVDRQRAGHFSEIWH